MEKVKEDKTEELIGVSKLSVKGSYAAFSAAGTLVDGLIAKIGPTATLAFAQTAYFLPVIYAGLGVEVSNLQDAKNVLSEVKKLLPREEAVNEKNLLELALQAGIVTAVCAEIIEACRYLSGELPEEGFAGFIPDVILRQLGLQLVDGRLPGVAVIVGAAPDSTTAVRIIRQFQERSILSLLVGTSRGTTFKDQLDAEGVKMGLESYIVPIGRGITSVIHAANFAIRGALTFGGCKKGQMKESFEYCRDRVPAFILALGELDELKVSAACAAIRLGFPVITDQDVPAIGKTPFTLYEALVTQKEYDKIVQTCIVTRGVKVKVEHIAIPVPYSAAFEGERVRREQMYVQFGGKYSKAFELVTMRQLNEIEDQKVTVVGPEIDDAKEGSSLPLGIFVEVAGRKMQKDFEPILERQIHSFLNEAMGIFHMGQRNMCWIRISREAQKKGLKIKHFGTIIHARLHDTFGKIVDKAQITLYTNETDVQRLMPDAQKIYEERDARIAGMTDESVDTFYSCTLCQSFAPNHLCIVKPERLGLCGAYSWLDAKASYELNQAGANQPIKKGKVIDGARGEWQGVNDFIYQKSNKTLERFHGYSIMTFPETSCGCFECIIAILPETSGFMVVNREYPGMTPTGMTFSTLAGSVGGGAQTPGFMGVGRLYITSRKFISADGGLRRLVWMPKELKEYLAERLKKRCQEEGAPGLFDMIADETVATDSGELLSYLQKVNHPALSLPPLM